MTVPSDLTSKTFQRAEKHLQGKITRVYLQKYKHYAVPGYNLNKSLSIDDWNVNNVKQLYKEFPYECDLPKPLLPPAKLPRTVLHEEDPALETISVKSYMNDDINRIAEYCDKHKKEMGRVKKKIWAKYNKKQTAVVPKYIAEVAELIELDPDPYLKGNYNWYYTGGNLCNVKIGDQTILLYPYAGELIASPLMPLENALWKPMLKKSTKTDLDSTLYELRCTLVDDMCRIMGRYKNNIILYKLSRLENKLKLFQIHEQPSISPYVSGDLSTFNNDYHCTVDMDHKIYVWNINRIKHVTSNEVFHTKVLEDYWGTIKYQCSDPNTLIFTDRCCLRYLDTRLPYDLPALTLCPKQYLEQCENLSLEVGSRYDFCRYIGTYHSLLLCDSRSPKQCIRQKWTHQFKSTPLLLPTINRDEEEILLLSSLLAGESSVILNSWTDEASHSYNLPFNVPNIMETLNESQLQGLCLDPYLKSRLELCTTGSTLLSDQNGDVFSFVQTSIGDIFYQCITHKDKLDERPAIKEKSITALDAWEQVLLTQDVPIVPLHLTNKYDMKNVYESFTNRRLRLLQNNKQNDDSYEMWRQSILELASYEDILAKELLPVWEISDASVSLTTAPHEKVLNWLESTNTKASPVHEDIEYVPTPVNTQELMSISQEPDLTSLHDSNVLQELLLPKVRAKLNKKKKHTTK